MTTAGLPRVCSACNGPLFESPIFESAYVHSPTCRIGRRVSITRQLAEFRELLDQSSLGTPGAKALRDIGRLCMQGRSYEQACAEIGPDQVALANTEVDQLIIELAKMRTGQR